MILTCNDEDVFELPDAECLREKLSELDYDEFAVLQMTDQYYMQTYHNDDDSWALEYRAGSAEAHYFATNHNGLEDVMTAFQLYLEKNEEWISKWTWELVDFEDDEFIDE